VAGFGRWATAFVVGGVVVTGLAGTGTAVAGATAGRTAAGMAPLRVGPMLPAPPDPGITAAAEDSQPVVLSANWSGYAATSTTTAKFDSVQGDFVQPAVVCSGVGGRYVAVWTGLDGYKDQTVEQDGTFGTCGGPAHETPTYFAWYEMYPSNSVNTFPVSAGDDIQTGVSYSGGMFTLTIADTTSDQSKSYTAACRSCRRTSAEWIVERPELCTNKGKCFLGTLPDFTSASPTSDTAGTDVAAAAPISSFTNIPIDMVQPKGQSVSLLAQTGVLDPTGEIFTTTWERTGRRLPLSG
jgi:hypothetical protein